MTCERHFQQTEYFGHSIFSDTSNDVITVVTFWRHRGRRIKYKKIFWNPLPPPSIRDIHLAFAGFDNKFNIYVLFQLLGTIFERMRRINTNIRLHKCYAHRVEIESQSPRLTILLNWFFNGTLTWNVDSILAPDLSHFEAAHIRRLMTWTSQSLSAPRLENMIQTFTR